jgi:transketolase
MTMTYGDVLGSIARDDDRYVVMTAENRAPIRALPALLGHRFLDTGITEQTMVGMAAGLALRGRIPVIHALATFLTMRAFEFIRTDIGIPALPVKIVGTVPGILSEANGPTHQAIEDIALMRGIPNMRVFAPADADDLVRGLPAVLDDPYPWYIRHCDRVPVSDHAPFVIGKAEVVAAGPEDDVAILVAGALWTEVVAAAAALQDDGLRVRLINMRSLKPVDDAVIATALREVPIVVTVEDHFAIGGLATIVAEIATRERLVTHLVPLSFGHRWFTPALLQDALTAARLDAASLADRIRSALATFDRQPA